MFSKATANIVRQIDPEGSLIHVSRLNDSQKLFPMALVVKRNRFWAWQRPKYQPTDFSLGDLLQGNEKLSPGVSEEDFLTYSGAHMDRITGKVETQAGPVSATLEGRGSYNLQSSFGKLKKKELDVKRLVRDSETRMVNMQHMLMQQLEKKAEVLAVVKDIVITAESCSIKQTKKEQCALQGVLGLVGLLGSFLKVCVSDRSSIHLDSDESLEIPPGTVVAYSVRELEIKSNGHFMICLQPGTIGGIESDSVSHWNSHDSLNVVDGRINDSQERDLFPLAELPQSTRSELFKKLQDTMKDKYALSMFQSALEESRLEDTSDVPAHLNAIHLLVSAMEELPDETLNLLSKSHPDFLEAFNMLIFGLKESCLHLPVQSLPVSLKDNQNFQLAEQLLLSTDVTLTRRNDELWAETKTDPQVLPLVLCLSVHGLTLLCKEQQL
ncbi:gasdermin-E-like [Sphaeramia orbicularis]|uniref:Gasdermin-E-like n=1 Tax=Sphaeramia orbicularis TaxID=375764 RepID=A0A673BH11_9TELE|nr:gasdermin-E-like [Sphaeramia orbicularis]